MAGHWFGGEAKKAIIAAKSSPADPDGDAAYKSVRRHLDLIYGQETDSAADALARLKEGGAISEKCVVAHQGLYLNLLEAQNAAEAADGMELFNRRSTLLEIVHARAPFYAEKYFCVAQNCRSFQRLLEFISGRIDLLKMIHPPTHEHSITTTVYQKDDNTTHSAATTDYRKDDNYAQVCSYCQGTHSTTLCGHLVIMSLDERIAVANKRRWCFHCCEKGHGAKNCPEKKNVTCTSCNRRGHIALFHGRQMLPPRESSDQSRRDSSDDETNSAADDDETNSTIDEAETDEDRVM